MRMTPQRLALGLAISGLMATDLAAAQTVAGEGRVLGPPVSGITVGEQGPGVLSGTYIYAYTEVTALGESTPSVTSTITVTGGKTIRVTTGNPRRGTSGRNLYRTEANGTVLKFVHSFGGGSGWHQTAWDDNTPDSALGAVAPTVDTSMLYNLEVYPGVKYLRTHPSQGPAVGDLTVLTCDWQSGYCVDVYGPVYARSKYGNTYGGEKTGLLGSHLWFGWQDNVFGAPLAPVFQLQPQGHILQTPITLYDSSLSAWNLVARFPTTITASRQGAYFSFTGNGSSAFNQQGFRVDFAAGYTGTSQTMAGIWTNGTASQGASYAMYGLASGASARTIGVLGRAQGGTVNIGVFAGLGVDPNGFGESSALSASNGTGTDAIFTAYEYMTKAYQILGRRHQYAPVTFATLGTPADGQLVYCGDCAIANPCTGGGTGAFAKRLAGAWVCN